jgi:predicted aldo/keto reductase-like oxidoreductase
MIYRQFRETGITLSQLGFGAMRFPLKERYDPTSIDEKNAKEMLYYAIDHGVNIVDSAWPYHRETSETFLGKALTPAYRDKVFLSTKMPMWLIQSKADRQKYFDEQRKRLQSDKIDMYLLHSLGTKSWATTREHDVLAFLEKMKAQEKIGYIGFSFHDKLPLFKEIVDAYPWTFCLIFLNYVDDEFQAGVGGLEYAHSKGLAVMIMEPLRGGKLCRNTPPEIIRLIAQTGRTQSPAEFALRWVFDRPEVCCVLSGMNTLEQVKQNIAFASIDHRNTVSVQEKELYKQAKAFFKARTQVACSECGYCTECPQKIPISFVLNMYNDAHMYNAFEQSQWMYRVFIKPENRADQCTACGECEEKCPQDIEIIGILEKAHKELAPEP